MRLKRNKESSIRLCYYFAPLFFTISMNMRHTLSILTKRIQLGVKLDVFQRKGYGKTEMYA